MSAKIASVLVGLSVSVHQRVGHSTGDFTPGSSLQLTGLFQESPDFESKGEFHRPFSTLHLFVFELHFL
jgi:hypothetical protein